MTVVHYTYNRVAFRCEEYRNVVSFKSSALYANILYVYIRAELINHSHPRKKRTKKIYMLEKGESIKSQFHSTKLPGIIADTKSRGPSKFCDSTFLRIIFYIEKLNRHSSILFLSDVKVIYNGLLRMVHSRSEGQMDEGCISHLWYPEAVIWRKFQI